MTDLDTLEKLAENPAKLQQHLSNVVDIGMAVITAYGFKVIGAIVIMIVGWIVAGMLQNAILRVGRRSPRLDVTVFTFLASITRYGVLVFAIVAMLEGFGVPTTSFVAMLGAAGLAVGLALQGTLSHVASGMMLIVFRPFRVGDQVEAAGIAGVVRSIALFVTEIDTADNVRIVIPNGLIWSRDIKNFTANGNRRAELRFQVSYANDLDQALTVVKKIITSDERILQDPAPVVGVQGMTVDGVIIGAQFWLQRATFAEVPLDINKEVKAAFDRAGLTFSVPHQAAPARAIS